MASTPTAAATTDTSSRSDASSRYQIPFVCKHSGLLLGSFFPNVGLYNKTTLDGMSPYVRNWQEAIILHPIFSVSTSALLIRARETYMLQKSGKLNFPMQQRQLMMLAILHAGNAVVQDKQGLPEPRIADTYFAQVLEVVDWKVSTGSARLILPKLHIWKESGFEQIPAWLKACAELKEEYENVARTHQNAAKRKAAEWAMKNIKKNLYENISLRRLWNWVEVQVDSHEFADWPEMKDLFFVDEKNIGAWTQSEVETLEEIFLEYCEMGNSISYEVSKRIREIAGWLSLYEDTFEILTTDQFPEFKGVAAPKIANFPNKTAFLVAEAKWKLANKVQQVVNPEGKAGKRSSTKILDEEL